MDARATAVQAEEREPSIAVVVATRDRPATLLRALRSIATQTRAADEVIIVDDGSSVAVCEHACRAVLGATPLILLRNERPLGPGQARNRGIAKASSEWISLLDDDDEFLPQKLEVTLGRIQAQPACDAVYHPGIIYLAAEDIAYTTRLHRLQPVPLSYRDLLVRNWIGGTPLVTVRRQLLLEVGGFDPSLPAYEDFELWLRLARQGARMCGLEQALTRCWIVTREPSLSKHREDNQRAMQMIRQKHQILGPGTLTPSEQLAHRLWCLSGEIRRALYRYDDKEASQVLLRKMRLAPSLTDALMLLALLFGPRFVFRLRALLAPA